MLEILGRIATTVAAKSGVTGRAPDALASAMPRAATLTIEDACAIDAAVLCIELQQAASAGKIIRAPMG